MTLEDVIENYSKQNKEKILELPVKLPDLFGRKCKSLNFKRQIEPLSKIMG